MHKPVQELHCVALRRELSDEMLASLDSYPQYLNLNVTAAKSYLQQLRASGAVDEEEERGASCLSLFFLHEVKFNAILLPHDK